MDIKTVYNQEDEQEPVTPEKPEEIVTPPNHDEEETPPENGCSNSIYPWSYQSIPNFYDRVRTALNVGSGIDDTTIDFFEYAPMAEMDIKKRLPNYEELDKTQRLIFDTCIVYMACYKLCPLASTMRITRQKDPSLEIEFASSSTKEQPCERFLMMVDDLIAQINGEEPSYLFGFKVTRGSGCNVVKPCWPYHGRSVHTPLWGEK